MARQNSAADGGSLVIAHQVRSGGISKARRSCPYCSKNFSKNDHLVRHLRSHTKEKPFRCMKCGKSYPRRDTLVRHTRLHTERTDGSQSLSSTAIGSAQQLLDLHSSSTNISTRPLSFQILPEQTVESNVASTAQGQLTNEDAAHDDPVATRQPDLVVGNDNASETGPEFSSWPHAIDEGLLDDGFALTDSLFGVDTAGWFLDNNFFDVFDHSSPPQRPCETQPFGQHVGHAGAGDHRGSEVDDSISRVDPQRSWYTQIRVEPQVGTMPTGAGSVANAQRDDIDETYRARMINKLVPTLRDEPLPSIDFLNLCIRLFFTNFNVALPLVHGPTFRPTSLNVLLVLSLCSAGTLSMGSEMATRSGCMLFERVNKTGMSNYWEKNLALHPGQTRGNIQAAIIGQSFALLSGDPAHRATAAALHGAVISVVRHAKGFQETPVLELDEYVSPEELDRMWRAWVLDEELKRAAVVLYVHDAEIAALFHHEPIFRHHASTPPTVSSAELFSAPTAAAWVAMYRAQKNGRAKANYIVLDTCSNLSNSSERASVSDAEFNSSAVQANLHERSMLNVYASLAGIGASICECRHLGLLSPNLVNKFESDLVGWYRMNKDAYNPRGHQAQQQPEYPFDLLPLWHSTFIALNVDLSTIELAVGKESTTAASSQEYVRSWILSPDLMRCLFHALYLQNLLMSARMGSLITLHTPRIIFSAALCWASYIMYSPLPTHTNEPRRPAFSEMVLDSLPEVRLLREERRFDRDTPSNLYTDTRRTLKRLLAVSPAETRTSTLCVLESLLRRLGTNGISKTFADLVQGFILREA